MQPAAVVRAAVVVNWNSRQGRRKTATKRKAKISASDVLVWCFFRNTEVIIVPERI
jgi:hypothetical protein